MILTFWLLGLAAAAPSKPEYGPTETRQMIDEYGTCIVRKERKKASEAIARNVDNSTLMRKYPQIADAVIHLEPPPVTAPE